MVFFPSSQQVAAHDEIKKPGHTRQQRTDVERADGRGINEPVHGFADDGNACDKNECTFKTCRYEFDLAMAIRMVLIFWDGCKVNAEECECARHRSEERRVGKE